MDKLEEDSISEINEEELEMTDDDEEDLDEDALLMLMKAAQTSESSEQFKAPYSQGSEYSKRSIRRHNQQKNTLAESAKGCIPLTANFLGVKKNTNIGKSQSLKSSQTISGLGSETQDLTATQEQALADLEKFVSLKKNYLHGQFLTRHRTVQSFLKLQLFKPEQNRIKCAWQVAECFGKGVYLAQKIVTWERQWVTSRCIEDGNQGCHAKSHSWFND